MKPILLAAAVLLMAPAAAAERLDFGGWCSQIAKFSQDRCLEERAEDRLAYGRYLESIKRYDKELINKQNADQIESDRVNRMGDVTPDQDPVEGAASPR